jgi:hypothetical protein
MQLSERDLLIARVIARAKLPLAQERFELESSLLKFVEAAWPSLDPAPYAKSWAVDALCEHMQALAEGQIKRLLVNIPPRSSKTNVASILFPAWIWSRSEKSYLSGPQVRFLCGSYMSLLSLMPRSIVGLCSRLSIKSVGANVSRSRSTKTPKRTSKRLLAALASAQAREEVCSVGAAISL